MTGPRDYTQASRAERPVSDRPPAAAAGTIAIGELIVNRMGLGARWAVGNAGVALLRRAVELGINFIDTADVYGGGANERLIAEALHPYPGDLVIATKGGQVSKDGAPASDGRPEHLRAACEASLQRLGLDTIHLYQLHQPDPDVPLEESLGALVELQTAGKIRHIGVSNVFGPQLERAIASAPVVAAQSPLSVTDRRMEEDVARCERGGLAFIPYRPLGGGELVGSVPARLALAWLLERSRAVLPIPGTRSLEHVEENLEAAAYRLSAEDRERIASLG